MKFKFSLLLLLFISALSAQNPVLQEEEIAINEFINGSLMVPPGTEEPPLVILIAGSGPTDRNGNQSFMKNDSFKKLAQALGEKGIASFRYDKRSLSLQKLGISEEDIRFDDFVTDAASILEYFNKREGFGKIIIIGHSQGSLIGMLAAKDNADAFISLAGAGRPIDSIIVEQIGQQMPGLKENARQGFSELRQTGGSSSYNPMLGAIFRPSVQSFLLSWMRFDPAVEIANLEMPILLINGTNDFQTSVSEAELLKKAKPAAELVLIENMNHVLKEIESTDTLTNSKSYNEPQLPLHPELVPTIVGFIKDL